MISRPVFRSIGVVLELVVATPPRGDDVLPSGGVEAIELVLEYQTAAVVVEVAPQGIRFLGRRRRCRRRR